MGKPERIDALMAKHRDLEGLIEVEEKRAQPDEVTLHDLKKQKLRIKDELQSIGAT